MSFVAVNDMKKQLGRVGGCGDKRLLETFFRVKDMHQADSLTVFARFAVAPHRLVRRKALAALA